MKGILLAIVFAAFQIACAEDGQKQTSEIGVSTSLTGSMAPFGADIKNALILANDLYGNGRYHLNFEDDQCNNQQAVSIAHKLTSVRKIRYVLGQVNL